MADPDNLEFYDAVTIRDRTAPRRVALSERLWTTRFSASPARDGAPTRRMIRT